MSHTPGPWRVETDEWCDARGTVKGIYGPDYARIVVTDSGMYPPDAEDAYLIAAAPDLLAALKSCLDVLIFVAPSQVPNAAIHAARAAIAKAEGAE